MRTSAVTNAVTAAAIGLVLLACHAKRARRTATSTRRSDPLARRRPRSARSPGSSLRVVVQPDRKVIVARDSYSGTGYEVALVRYTEFGELDSTFGADGIVPTSFPGPAHARAVAVQADGNIVVAGGRSRRTGESCYSAMRRTAPSTPPSEPRDRDHVFGGLRSGRVSLDPGRRQDRGRGRTSQTTPGGQAKNVFALARYETDGTLDATFGTGGRVTTSFGSFTNRGMATALAIQPDGQILLGGYTTLGDSLQWRWPATRRTALSTARSTAAASRRAREDHHRRPGTWAYAIAYQADGKILLGGGNRTTGSCSPASRASGPWTSFGSYGIVTTLVTPGLTPTMFGLGPSRPTEDRRGRPHFQQQRLRLRGRALPDERRARRELRHERHRDHRNRSGWQGHSPPATRRKQWPSPPMAVSSWPGTAETNRQVISSPPPATSRPGPPPADPRADLSLAMIAAHPSRSSARMSRSRSPSPTAARDATGVRVRAILPFSLTFQSAPGGALDPCRRRRLERRRAASGDSRRADARRPSRGRSRRQRPRRRRRFRSARPRLDAGEPRRGRRRPGEAAVSPRAVTPADLSLGLASNSLSPPPVWTPG